MNVDLFISISLFIIFLAWIIYYLVNLGIKETYWTKSLELRKIAIEFTKDIISYGSPINWEKDRTIPFKVGLTSSYYSISILISDNSGYDRINEPVSLSLILDEDCLNLVWNETLRIYDENFKEIPFKFVKQEFCPSGYLKNVTLFFEVNVSANSSKVYQILFSNTSSVKFKDYGNFSSLVLYLTFDEGNGNIAYDYSGNNNHGILYNGSIICSGLDCPNWVDGKFGKAIQFDGINDYVNCGNNTFLNPISQITILFWIKPSNPSGSRQTLIANSPSDGQYNYWLYLENNSLKLSIYATTYPLLTLSDVITNANNWYYIAFSAIEGGLIRVLINGAQVESESAGTNHWTGSYTTIGDLRPDEGVTFNGTIDEVRIYNRILTDEEIISHYQNPLEIKVFPVKKIDLLSFEKMEVLRNFSYDVLKEAIQKNYNFRVEIYEK